MTGLQNDCLALALWTGQRGVTSYDSHGYQSQKEVKHSSYHTNVGLDRRANRNTLPA